MDKSKYRPRLIDSQVEFYLSTFGAVCIEGTKWCGKTWTSTMHSKSAYLLSDPKDDFANKRLAQMDVSKALTGDAPHLIDEWQEVPKIWDAVRFEVDASGIEGRFILTGSSTPTDNNKGVVHSGTGRIASLKMYPMSLFESGDSAGIVSLEDICVGRDIPAASVESPSLEKLAELAVCGGWPGGIGKSAKQRKAIALEYVENIINIDINKVPDNIPRAPDKVRKCLRSLARNESTTAAASTIQRDTAGDDGTALSINTIGDYISLFARMFLTDDIAPFSTFLRSPSRIKQAVKRHFCDPSVAAALMGASENRLLRDLRTFGFLFESLVLRDLRVYAQSLDAKLYHYQDYGGLEMDAVVEFDDGNWTGIEVKLNPADVDSAAANLLKIARNFKHKPPRSLAVIVGKSPLAYRREDGVYVIPITALKS